MTTIADRMTQTLNLLNAKIENFEQEVNELRGMLKACQVQRVLSLELFSASQKEEFDKRLKALRNEKG